HAERLDVTTPPGVREFRQRSGGLCDERLGEDERWQIGLREVAVIVRILLRPLAEGHTAFLGPTTRLLEERATGPQYLGLPLHLILQRAIDAAEGVDVLDFHLRAELRRAARAERDIRIAAERALFHIARRGADVAQEIAQRREID